MAVAAIKAGAEDFIEKPVDDAHLLAAINRALARMFWSAWRLPWQKRDHRLDVLGSLLVVLATVALMLALALAPQPQFGWSSPIVLALLAAGCSKHPAKVSQSDADFHKKLQTQLIEAKDGEVIELPAGKWTFNRSLSLNKSNVTIRGVTVESHGPNSDGCDPESCRDVLIENCTFDTGDDCVVLKSGYNEDGWRVGRATENVIMRNCTSKRGHGGLVIGSEMLPVRMSVL
ncbi:MAG: hypothetical protein HC868_10250 [Sphingomonadales bacterium]|nr:hypothetical protein [Sphingomonadales bacterium]